MNDRSAKYRINAVSERTGVAAATLRAWERRYGVPTPNRTDSSYRLYSEDDVAIIQRLIAMRDEGMSPAEAAKVLLARRPNPRAAAAETARTDADKDAFTALHDDLLDAIRRYDPDALRDGLAHALSLGSAVVISKNVLMPVMRTIGRRWQSGEFSISQEHMATQIIESSARKLLDLLEPSEPSAPRVVLGCFADDQHSLPLLAVALELAGAGFRIVSLGPRTPPSSIRDAVEALAPACVGLSITIDLPENAADDLVEAYGNACGQTPWIVGGRGAEATRALVESHGGHIANRCDQPVAQQIDGLLARGRNKASGQ